MSDPKSTYREFIRDIATFTLFGGKLKLRSYQLEVAQRICDSVLDRVGLTFVIMFPRQSGKNELQAQIEAYLLNILHHTEAEIVKVSPTYKPQTMNAMRRLERVLAKNVLTRKKWVKESGYIYRLGMARIIFLSGTPEANIVGATASTLLEVDEAQDVEIAKFDKDIAPMAASTNATRVFWGTAWTSQTLLGRELRAARHAETADGLRRVFVLTAEDVGREVPAYRRFVEAQVARLGRQHLMVRTQFFSEEIDGQAGMFPAERVAMMQGDHSPLARPGGMEYGPLFEKRTTNDGPPTPSHGRQVGSRIYCMLIDVGGEDQDMEDTNLSLHPDRVHREDASRSSASHDSTALTIVEVDLATLGDPVVRAPTYRVVHRRQWSGVRYTSLYAELQALAKTWYARWLVVDATGIGAGLASFLSAAFPGRVIPFIFSQASKSRLGWGFITMVDGGRWKDYTNGRTDGGLELQKDLQAEFYRQVGFCQYEIQVGPARAMTWGVPDGTRDPVTGQLVHDDLLVSAALACVLDEQAWQLPGQPGLIRAVDPLKEMEKGW
jgi:hypothetical protein